MVVLEVLICSKSLEFGGFFFLEMLKHVSHLFYSDCTSQLQFSFYDVLKSSTLVLMRAFLSNDLKHTEFSLMSGAPDLRVIC